MDGIEVTCYLSFVQMEEQKSVELNMDCLVNVLGRVEMDSLLFAVPYVCKSRYQVSLDPVCWKRFVFPHFEQTIMKRFMKVYQSMRLFSVTSFINSILHCSNRLATALMLPDCCTKEALEYAVDEGPALKVLRGSWQRKKLLKLIEMRQGSDFVLSIFAGES